MISTNIKKDASTDTVNRSRFERLDALIQKIPFFEIGLQIILFIFFTVLISTLLLLVNIPVNPVSLILGFILSAGTMYCLGTRDFKKLGVLFVSVTLIFLISVGVSCVIYDVSCDGEAYHKPAVGLLNLGWNPIYETTTESIERLNIEHLIPSGNIIADVYAKATWIFAASCYSIFGDIESGKCYTLLGMIALFCIVTSFLIEKANLRGWQAVCCSFFLAANPVNLSQMFTYYNDGFLSTLVLIYISCFLYLSYGRLHKYHAAVFVLIFATACVGMNVKFSGLMYFGIFGAVFYFFWIFRKVKQDGLKKSIKWIRNLSLFFTILVLCSCLLFGSTVYVPNTINHENPVYGLVGDTNLASIDRNMPVVLQNTPGELRFISSMFYPSTNSMDVDTLNFKIPFTFTISEIIISAWCDCRISGWGIMFSGIFILGLISMVSTLIMSWSKNKEIFSLTLILMLGIIVPSTLLTGMWWARYNSLPFLVQTFLLIFMFVLLNYFEQHDKVATRKLSRKNITKVCLIVILCISLVNVTPGFAKTPVELATSLIGSDGIDNLRDIPEGQFLEVSTNEYGRLFNLIDRDIEYIFSPLIESPNGHIFNNFGYEWGIISYHIV